jgi:dolichol-phosphate mannosyltransferase
LTASEGRKVLTVVVPVYNEAEGLARFHARLREVLAALPYDTRVLYVDDGSDDGSFDVLAGFARDAGVGVLRLSRNFGHQIALTAGLDHAAGDAVVTMDADLEMPPELIPELVARWERGADIVHARRVGSDGAGLGKRATSRWFYAVLNRLSEVPIEPDVPDFRLLARAPLDVLRGMRERHRFLRGLVSLLGFAQDVVPFHAGRRVAGRSKYSFGKMLGLAVDALVSFSVVPLRLSVLAGFVAAAAGAVYGGYVVWTRLFRATAVPGWASTTTAVLVLGGMILVVLGIIGEYVARIYGEAKGRPLYIVRGRMGIDASDGGPGRVFP